LSFTQFDAEDAEGVKVSTDQPREMLKLFTTYQFPDALNTLTIGGGINWEGDNYTDTFNPISSLPERLTQDAYYLVNLMLRYDISANLNAQLNISNLLDEEYYSQIGFYDQIAFGEPRNFNLHVKYEF